VKLSIPHFLLLAGVAIVAWYVGRNLDMPGDNDLG
jgi:hypothetical protein